MSMYVAYLAPEIPGASSTFVYNEIFELEKNNTYVEPFSIHTVEVRGDQEKVRRLAEKCQYLYDASAWKLFLSQVKVIYQSPISYLHAFCVCLNDAISCVKQPNVAFGLVYRFFISAYFVSLLKSTKVSHIHCHFSHIATDVGMYASIISGIPYSFTAHANDIFQRGYLLRKKGERASFVSTISKFNIEILKEAGIPADKLTLIRCGVDRNNFPPKIKSSHSYEVRRLGFLGRLVEKKGVDLLLDAMKILSEREINLKLEVMGDGPLQGALVDRVRQLGLENQVTFGGSMPHSEVANWYERIDYFIFPGKKDQFEDMDGIPVVLMEAMMRGVPVIATSISGIPELVQKNITGRLAEPDALSLADEIAAAVIECDDERKKRVERAISLVQSEFDVAENANLLLEKIVSIRETAKCQISLPN